MKNNSKNQNMGRTIRLRALRKEDAEITWKWRNQASVREMYSGHPFFVNPEKESAWYEKVLLSDFPNASFGVEIDETETLIGLSFLLDISFINRSAGLAFLFGEESQKRPRDFLRSVFLTLDFAFYKLNLNRVYGKVNQEHQKLMRFYEYYGGKREGVLRQSIYRNGEYVDEICMAILKEDYESIVERPIKKSLI